MDADLERQRAEAVAGGDVGAALELMTPEEAALAFAYVQTRDPRKPLPPEMQRSVTYQRPAGTAKRRAKAKAARRARKRNRR